MRTWAQSWPRSVSYGSGIAVSCGVGHRCGLDLVLLWLWHRLIQPPARELPYAVGTALKGKKKKKKKKKEGNKLNELYFYHYLNEIKGKI